ncbi:MAG: hypothetical protein MUE54_14270 [Anaerolineae bacterium]|nr:hypothetical protein [Anaerolineae bacterium]
MSKKIYFRACRGLPWQVPVQFIKLSVQVSVEKSPNSPNLDQFACKIMLYSFMQNLGKLL